MKLNILVGNSFVRLLQQQPIFGLSDEAEVEKNILLNLV
ncbi:hypothetical protein FAES_1644 [Fibrella aestuarina BUZ 2]|uniref:Uncharacterized protein n=1 Tax=Fibrella aestuarina BUZ 2 TaxID=1166018 RepID=I0K6A1_9BACT|nr:hypothetical protein FAES_1644 [Fibrella aestuarina BUZ 2]